MSKIVKKAGRAIKKVVKGVGKVVKKIAKSPIGKMVLIAAATYFGVPMLAGALGGAAAGTGIAGTLSGALSGAGSGLAQAWGGLTGAASALGSGSFSGAANALAGGFSPSAAYGAGGGVMNLGVTDIGVGTASAGGGGGGAGGMALDPYSPPTLAELGKNLPNGLTTANASAAPAGSSGGGILSGMMGGSNSSILPSLIQAGSSMIGAIGQQKMAKEEIQAREDAERRLREEEQARRNGNMGVLFASQSDPGPGYYQKSSYAPRFQS